MKTDRVAFVIAMRSEAEPLIKSLGLTAAVGIFPETVPFETFTGEFSGRRILLTVGGIDEVHGIDNVASQPATLMTWLAIDRFKPDLVINAGTAGGMGRAGCEIGDVYLSGEVFRFHDRRIPLPRFREYGIGSYPSFDTSGLARQLGLKRGIISTGDSLDMTETDLVMIRVNGAVIKEMEAAAVAWVCRITRTPMFAVKAVTDLIDGRETPQKQFMANLRLAVDNLQDAIRRILSSL